MKTNRIFFALLLFLVACNTIVLGQISSGKPTVNTHFKNGNRPVMGDMGIYIGTSYSDICDMIDSDIDFDGLPLMNIKYYSTQNLEYRVGMVYSSRGSRFKGVDSVKVEKNIESNTLFRLSPGLAYHFSPYNIIDAYIGASIPLGFDSDYRVDDFLQQKQKKVILGLNTFLGLQAFVADLPISIGVEFGMSGNIKFGDKVKNIIDDGSTKQVYYTTNFESDKQYIKLHRSSRQFGSDVRINISYYFNNKKNYED